MEFSDLLLHRNFFIYGGVLKQSKDGNGRYSYILIYKVAMNSQQFWGFRKDYSMLNKLSPARKILVSLLLLGILINGLAFFNIRYLYTREIFSSIYLLLFPGLLLSWVIY